MKSNLIEETLFFTVGWGVLFPIFVGVFVVIGGTRIVNSAIKSGQKATQKILLATAKN